MKVLQNQSVNAFSLLEVSRCDSRALFIIISFPLHFFLMAGRRDQSQAVPPDCHCKRQSLRNHLAGGFASALSDLRRGVLQLHH